MAQDPYRSTPKEPGGNDEDDHPAAKAASVALCTIIVAVFAFQDRAPSSNLVIVGLFLSAVVLLAAWRAGKRA